MRKQTYLEIAYPLSHRLSRAYRCLSAYSYWKTPHVMSETPPQALVSLLCVGEGTRWLVEKRTCDFSVVHVRIGVDAAALLKQNQSGGFCVTLMKLPAAEAYLLFVPVEAVALVMVDCSLVAPVLGQVRPIVQNLLRRQPVARHSPDHPEHGVGQHLPDLRASTAGAVELLPPAEERSSSVSTLRWLLISIRILWVALRSLEAIIFLLRMARGTSGLGVRSRSVTGGGLVRGGGGTSALGLPWKSTTFM